MQDYFGKLCQRFTNFKICKPPPPPHLESTCSGHALQAHCKSFPRSPWETVARCLQLPSARLVPASVGQFAARTRQEGAARTPWAPGGWPARNWRAHSESKGKKLVLWKDKTKEHGQQAMPPSSVAGDELIFLNASTAARTWRSLPTSSVQRLAHHTATAPHKESGIHIF